MVINREIKRVKRKLFMTNFDKIMSTRTKDNKDLNSFIRIEHGKNKNPSNPLSTKIMNMNWVIYVMMSQLIIIPKSYTKTMYFVL